MSEPLTRSRVFISYARQDGSTLAEELVTALGVVGFEAYLDRHDIAAAEDWENRLDALICQADVIVFVLTPRSVASKRCAWEVERALQLNKRIVPAVGIAVPDEAVPAALRRLNYVDFTPQRSFAAALARLVDALRVDMDWIREHTRIGELARRWEERSRADALLLRDTELSAAQAWASGWRAGTPALTEQQRAFIAASADAQSRRVSLERQRNESMAHANAERALALERSEQALKQLRRRTLVAGAGVSGLSLALAGVSLWALQVRRRAELAEHNAVDRVIAREAERQDLTGQVTAYATSPGLIALDSAGEGASPYTSTLLEQLASPSVSLWTALSRTSTEVHRRTKAEQRPFVSSDMNGDLYLSRPSPTRACKALLFAVGRFQRMPSVYFEGVYKDVSAWRDFLRARGFNVAEYLDPRHHEMRSAIEGVQMALGPSYPALRKVAITLTPDKARPAAESTGPASPLPSVAKPSPPKDTLLVVVYSGMGYDRAGRRYLAATDTDPEELKLAPAESLTSAVEVGLMEQQARDHAAASVMIYDTMFMSG